MKKSYLTIIVFPLSLLLLAACAGSRKAVEPPRDYNHEAMHHIINGAIQDLVGNPREALVEYHQAAEIDSASAGIYLALAENYFYVEEFKSSIRLVKKALQREPDNLDALELLAANLEKERDFAQAATVYEQIHRLNPDDLETLYSLTTLQIIEKEYARALRSYQKMVAAGLSDPEYRLRIGHLFFQNRALEQARAVYLDLRKETPDLEEAWLALAALSKAQQDTVEAIRIYRSALAQQSRFEEVKNELRLLYERSGRMDEAVALYRELVSRDSTNLGDKIQLGQYLFQQQDTLAAAAWFAQIIDQHPRSERGYLALGAVRRAQRDSAAAIAVYESALKANPLFLDARRRLRDLYAAAGRWDEAIDLYEAISGSDSTYVGARIEIANLLAQKGDTLQAIALCEALEKSNGDDWRVPLTLGRFYMVHRDFAKARPRFEKALTQRREYSLVWVLAGVNLAQMDSLAAAEKHFLAAVDLFPEDAEINYYLGFVSNRLGKRSSARYYLEKAYQLDSSSTQTMLALAALYDEETTGEEALRLYEALYKANPESPIVLNNYAYHLAVRKERLAEAKIMAEKALSLEPENGAYWDTLGWILYQSGAYAEARAKIEKSLDLSPDSAEVWEHLGDLLLQLGERQGARQAWEKALQLDPQRQQIRTKLDQTGL